MQPLSCGCVSLVLTGQDMITQKELKELLDYNSETGIFTIKKTGLIAQYPHTKGYIQINIQGITYLLHRLAWIYIYGDGTLKNLCIDHINRNKADNRIVNLRLVTRSINQRNHPLSTRNKSGKRGVYFDTGKNKWRSLIRDFNGKQVCLGRYKNLEDAIKAQEKAEVKYGYIT